MNKLIILDRDGVINEDSDNYIKSAKEWIPIPGSIEAIAELTKAGYMIAIATNQSGLARGLFDTDSLAAMHHKMIQLVENSGGKIESLKFCPHHPDDHCDCRKPKPGMLNAILTEFNVQPKDSWFVGDTLKDIQAGSMAGSNTALVKTGKGMKTLATGEGLENTAVFDDLSAFCKHILAIGF